MADVQVHFASTGHSPKRRKILAALEDHLEIRLIKDLTVRLLIDGGFVSAKPEPKDIDLVLGLAPGTMDAMRAGRLGL